MLTRSRSCSDDRVNRRTTGRFHTKIFNVGVEPAIQVHYRASKVKQYFKEGRALRTETTVNDTHDLGIGRLLTRMSRTVWNFGGGPGVM